MAMFVLARYRKWMCVITFCGVTCWHTWYMHWSLLLARNTINGMPAAHKQTTDHTNTSTCVMTSWRKNLFCEKWKSLKKRPLAQSLTLDSQSLPCEPYTTHIFSFFFFCFFWFLWLRLGFGMTYLLFKSEQIFDLEYECFWVAKCPGPKRSWYECRMRDWQWRFTFFGSL